MILGLPGAETAPPRAAPLTLHLDRQGVFLDGTVERVRSAGCRTVDLDPARSTYGVREVPMCPPCIATAAPIVAGATSGADWPRSPHRSVAG